MVSYEHCVDASQRTRAHVRSGDESKPRCRASCDRGLTRSCAFERCSPFPSRRPSASDFISRCRKNDPEPDTTSWIIFLGGILGFVVAHGRRADVLVALRDAGWRTCARSSRRRLGCFVFGRSSPPVSGCCRFRTFPARPAFCAPWCSNGETLFKSTWHSLLLLLGGYVVGAFIGVVTGICIGWFKQARYWGMPLFKVVGPIPATAWIPLAMVISPKPDFLRRRPGRARRLVPGHDAHDVRHREHARLLSRCGAHARCETDRS